MLGNFEKRQFADGEKIWLGQYQNLTNVLHWHFECELIYISEGTAQVKIGSHCFQGGPGDAFLCLEEDLHYIISEPGSRLDVLILERSITRDLTDRCAPVSSKLAPEIPVLLYLEKLRQIRSEKGPFYREVMEAWARTLMVEIYRCSPAVERRGRSNRFNDLISKINDEFAYITFQDAARYCGYSASYFSKMFRELSGMRFSDYLNIIKIENAVNMLHDSNEATITSVCRACGFATIRNFNRVFRAVTGYSPRTLPADYSLDTNLHISGTGNFDPTQESSVLL